MNLNWLKNTCWSKEIQQVFVLLENARQVKKNRAFLAFAVSVALLCTLFIINLNTLSRKAEGLDPMKP